MGEGFTQILIILFSDFLLDNFFDGIEMIILEHIILEILEFLITEGTTMVAIDCLLNAWPAVYMAASGNVTVIDGIETNCTLKLGIKPLWIDLKVHVVLLFDDHLGQWYFVFDRLKI